MIPDYTDMNIVSDTGLNIKQQPSKTYYLDIDNDRIYSYCTGLDAVKQAVYKLLNTERYEYIIYDMNYGVELKELFGKQIYYVVPELERRISEAVMCDDRVKAVTNFEIDYEGTSVRVSFVVESVFGEFFVERSVEV